MMITDMVDISGIRTRKGVRISVTKLDMMEEGLEFGPVEWTQMWSVELKSQDASRDIRNFYCGSAGNTYD